MADSDQGHTCNTPVHTEDLRVNMCNTQPAYTEHGRMCSVLSSSFLISILVQHRPFNKQQRRLVGMRHAHGRVEPQHFIIEWLCFFGVYDQRIEALQTEVPAVLQTDPLLQLRLQAATAAALCGAV